MGIYVSGYNISDIYVGNDKIDKIFLGDNLTYQSKELDCFYFQIDDPTKTAQVGIKRFITENSTYPADTSKFVNYVNPTFYYSRDKINWSLYTLNTAINIGNGYSDRVYFKGDNLGLWYDTYTQGKDILDDDYAFYQTYIYSFINNNNCGAYGNIMALRYSTPTGKESIPCDYAFFNFFSSCRMLTHAPELPATILANYCYYYMFDSCNALVQAPELPAIILNDYCYGSMYRFCTSLTTAPELPATTLAASCYYGMFNGCTSLTEAPRLPATTLADGCYGSMFSGCTSLTIAPQLLATTLTTSCYGGMFFGCTSLTTVPELSATTLANNCYSNMFSECTSLTTPPELPATTLATSCYYGMFQKCTSLTCIPKLNATTIPDGGIFGTYSNMFAETNVRANSTSSGVCTIPYRIPTSGTGTAGSKDFDYMFPTLDGSGKFTPTINTTFYINVPSI